MAQISSENKRETVAPEQKLSEIKPPQVTGAMLEAAWPLNKRNRINDELVDHINDLLHDYQLRESFRENLIGYGRVLQNPNYSLQEYVNAVRYVSYKMLGDTNTLAYSKTFPEKWQDLQQRHLSSKQLQDFVKNFNKTKIVNEILEQTLVPSYILNQDLYQKALNVQADLMLSAKSEKVRCDAANSLLTQLKMPETAKVELDVNIKQDESIDELRRSTLELVAQQKQMLASGAMNAEQVAHQKIIEGDFSREN